MSPIVTAAKTQPALRRGGLRPNQPATEWSCLLLAADSQRRRGLAEAARAAGWRVLACETVTEASRQHQQWLTQLTAVDLACNSGKVKQACREFVESVRSNGRLLLVSDESPSSEAEVWARRMSAWAYLPSPEFDDGLIGLFAEALGVASKSSAAGVSG